MRLFLVLALIAAVALMAASARFMFWPATDEPRRADAVVLFAGGRGERLVRAVQLMRDGMAANLVLSNGQDPSWPEANALCRGGKTFEVICFKPTPDTTRGEARGIATLAAERGWQSLIVVTSTYHVTRARLLMGRCYGGETGIVSAAPSDGPLAMARDVVREWFGLLGSIGHGC